MSFRSRSITAANIRLRELIDECLEEYQRSKSKVERSALVSGIIETVQGEKGRFIRQDPKTKRWFQVRSRTTREKVGQAIRAALKKKEQHDSQFAQAKQGEGSFCSSPVEHASYEQNYVLKSSARTGIPPISPPRKLQESPRNTRPFSPSLGLGHTRMMQLRHDRQGGSQDSQPYFDTIPLSGTTNVRPPSAFSPFGQSLYTGITSVQDFSYSENERNRYTNQVGIRNSSDSSFSPALGLDDLLYSRHRANNSLQRGTASSANVLPCVGNEDRTNAYGLLELQQESRSFPGHDGHAQQPLDAAAPAAVAAAARGASSWYASPGALFPETAAVFSRNSSPGLDNGHFPSIADAHQTASRSMMSSVAPNPPVIASPLSLAIKEEEDAKGASPTLDEGLHEN